MGDYQLYQDVANACSRITTRRYSTSFSLGIRFLSPELREPIYAIYGFVRLADEIVDSFHDHDKMELLQQFRTETFSAITRGLSLNPILHAFQKTVNKYNIQHHLIETFLDSMEMDLDKTAYNQEGYEKYILGSAEVVGLMCLHVFCNGDDQLYQKTEYYAMRLGSAFQKINFLRDMKADYQELGRVYFPGLDMSNFNDTVKQELEKDIARDFQDGFTGLKMLPRSSRLGVYVAYVYYHRLFQKIKHTPASRLMEQRIRIPNQRKFTLFVKSYLQHSFNLI
jgi:phytoene/squalene synthetase